MVDVLPCRQNRSFRCGDIAIFFEFSRWPPSPSLIFEIKKFYYLSGSRVADASACQISSKLVNRVRRYFWIFQARGHPLSWICLGHIWTTHSAYFSLYHSAKFGYDQCSSSYEMNLSIFGAFGKKCRFIPKIRILGQFSPLNGLHYQPKPEKAHRCASPRHLSHQTWNVVSGLKRGINKKIG